MTDTLRALHIEPDGTGSTLWWLLRTIIPGFDVAEDLADHIFYPGAVSVLVISGTNELADLAEVNRLLPHGWRAVPADDRYIAEGRRVGAKVFETCAGVRQRVA